jgi:hypothetical protein
VRDAIKNGKDQSKKLDERRRKTWEYINQQYEVIFGEKNQVKK